MRDLERLIARWRETMGAQPGVSPEMLDELENHLRETVDHFTRSGMEGTEAFERAAAQLGGAPSVASEFQKLDESLWKPAKAIVGIGMAILAMATICLVTLFTIRGTGLLLACHVLAVTLGYGATFLLGALGICFVGCRCYSDIPPRQLRPLIRLTFQLGCVAATFTIIGVVLAMIWARLEWGRYWAWDPKETGAFAVLVWQFCFLLANRCARHATRGILALTVLGNVVVSLGWFGANLFATPAAHGRSAWSILTTVILLHCAWFFLGFAPSGWLRLRKAP
jgi:hypothetical protein